MTDPKTAAISLVEKYMPMMYCYLGSGMLSNSYDENVARSNAKACAIIVCDEIINTIYKDEFWADYDVSKEFLDERNYWKSVKEQISKL